MLKIWGRANSTNVKKVVWAAEELGLPYERLEAGGAHGVVDTPEYRALNPNSLVPTIEDNGFVLWESNTIVAISRRSTTRTASIPRASPSARRRRNGWTGPPRRSPCRSATSSGTWSG